MFEELPHLLTDESHWAFEFVATIVIDLIVIGTIGRWWVARHDRKKHPQHA